MLNVGISKRLWQTTFPPDQKYFGRCRPLIIGGCARSGTTLLQSVLSSHAQVCVIPYETQAFCSTAYYSRPRELPELKIQRLRDHFAVHPISAECRYWCEKTPRNILFFEQILAYFGHRSRLIHIVRDGRDVITSLHPDEPDRYWVEPQRWVQDVSAGLAFFDHPQVLTLRYEDLVLNFESVIHQVMAFLKLAVTQHIMKYPQFATIRESKAWFHSATGMRADAIGRWRAPCYRERTESLVADPEAVRLLTRFHYL